MNEWTKLKLIEDGRKNEENLERNIDKRYSIIPVINFISILDGNANAMQFFHQSLAGVPVVVKDNKRERGWV